MVNRIEGRMMSEWLMEIEEILWLIFIGEFPDGNTYIIFRPQKMME